MSSPSDIAIMLNDEQLIRLVASWPKMTEEQREDKEFISIVAKIDSRYVGDLITRAKVHGLIMDSGGINEYAEKYINAIVAQKLKSMQGAQRKG